MSDSVSAHLHLLHTTLSQSLLSMVGYSFLCWSWDIEITYIGEEHKILFATCACEPVVISLARARLWPSSPQQPQIVFTFELMDWAEALLLECQVALKDFCKALYFKCQHLISKVSTSNISIALFMWYFITYVSEGIYTPRLLMHLKSTGEFDWLSYNDGNASSIKVDEGGA